MSDSPTEARRESSTLDEVGAAIRREGRELAGEARSTAARVARDQRDGLAQYISALAQAVRRGADELEASGYPASAATIKRTAGEVGGLAERLQRREPEELWADVEDFARDHPGLTFGAGFAVAFGLARFLRSGSPQSDEPVTPSAGNGSGPAGAGAPPAAR